jgi:tRNA(Ile)-lysidine synthase
MEPDPVPSAFDRAVASGLIPRGSSVLLAVSGGADSMALLLGAAEKAPVAGWRLAVGHVHHGWRGRAADRDLLFVSAYARRLNLTFFSRRRDARRQARELKVSPEAGARHARYEALAEMAREAGACLVATAHQLDDRLESYVMARERGVEGSSLAGPREKRGDGVVRPMLEVSRRQILDFLASRGASFRRDASNGDLRLARNRARRELARIARESGEEAVRELARRIRTLACERDRIEAEFGQRVLPAIHAGPGAVLADANLLSGCEPDIQRRAIDEMASRFAAPGRVPVTGREAEQILQRLADGGDFRFEAGRRIRFERRGPILRAAPLPADRPVRGNNSPGESVILRAADVKELSP